MNTAEFQQHTGGTALFIKIQISTKKGCGQLTSNYIYFMVAGLLE